MDVKSEEQLIIRKINDKASLAFYNGYPTHTEFLDLHEQGLFLCHLKEFPAINYKLFGGHEVCERKVIIFFPDDYEEEQLYFPIKLLHIQPSSAGSSEALSHRDYLGALMHLGIERYKMGDILCNEHGAFVFCMENIATYIYEQLIMVKNVNVTLSIKNFSAFKITGQNFDQIKGTVSSLRLDSILKLGFSLSRGNALDLIKAGKAYVNSRVSEKGSTTITEGSVISLRGYGKLKLTTVGDVTKKGRIFVQIDKYK